MTEQIVKSRQVSGVTTRSGSTTDGNLVVWNGNNADSIKDGGAVPAWKDASLQWYVGATQVTLHASSFQKYMVLNSGLCIVQAALAAAAGVNLTGILELRNLPVTLVAWVNSSMDAIVGFGEERNNGTAFSQTRLYVTTSGYLRFRIFNAFSDSNWNVVGNATFTSADSIYFTLMLPT